MIHHNKDFSARFKGKDFFMKLDRDKKLALFITIVTIIVLTGITYTFFSASVSNTNNEKIQTSTDEIEVPIKDIY